MALSIDAPGAPSEGPFRSEASGTIAQWAQADASPRRSSASSGSPRTAITVTDGRAVPLAEEIPGAIVHDKWLVAQPLGAVVVRAPGGPRGL